MIAGLLLTLLIIVCIAMVAVILMQRSEGGALGVGGGGGGGFMSARGAGDLLTRTTSILAGAFFVLCLALVFVSDRGSGSVTDRLRIQDIDPTAAPATGPGAPVTGGAPAALGGASPTTPAPAAGGGIQAPTPGLQSAPSLSILPDGGVNSGTAPATPSSPSTPAPTTAPAPTAPAR